MVAALFFWSTMKPRLLSDQMKKLEQLMIAYKLAARAPDLLAGEYLAKATKLEKEYTDEFSE